MCLLTICAFFWPSKILLITSAEECTCQVSRRSDKIPRRNCKKYLFQFLWFCEKTFFWMCDIQCGSYRQKHVGLGYSALCRQIYVVFCVWGTCRCLNQPSKFHCPPWYGIACSTTFSEKNKNKNLYNYNRVLSTAGPRKRTWPPNNHLKNNRDLAGSLILRKTIGTLQVPFLGSEYIYIRSLIGRQCLIRIWNHVITPISDHVIGSGHPLL